MAVRNCLRGCFCMFGPLGRNSLRGEVMPANFGARRILAASATRPWTPDLLGSALAAWWDPTQGVTLSGSSVSAWQDRIGGLVATQATAGNQPAFSATARNGKPGLLFNGSSTFLSFTPTGLPQGSSASTILVAAYSTGGTPRFAFLFGTTGANNVFRAIGENNSVIVGGTNNNDHATAIDWSASDRCMIWQLPAGASPVSTINLDGGSDLTKSLSTLNTGSNMGFIGALASNFAFWNGCIQQVLILSRVLTTTERQKLEGWESWVDGKAGSNLPSGHPYASRAPLTSDP